MKHYIVTRFNVKINGYQKDKNGKSTKDVNYLSQRFCLFERYCFPSIENQTNKNFKWLVYFDVDTPDTFKSRNNELILRMHNYEPIYVPDYNSFLVHYQSVCNETTETVIFTRFDNDDALVPEYINNIQNYVIQHNIENGVVDFPLGLIYDAQAKIMIKSEIKSYHFLSVVDTDRTQSKKLYSIHSKLKETQPYFVVPTNAPQWIELCHASNMLNDINRVNGIVVFKDKHSGLCLPISIVNSIAQLFRIFYYSVLNAIKYNFLRPLAVWIGIKQSL